EKEAHFEGCHFRQAAFNNVRFKDRAFFSVLRTRKDGHRATRFERADFSEAYFEKGGSFDGCLFWEADFGDASIQYVSFDGVDLDNVRFAGAQMEFAYLADARWSALPGRSRLRRLPHYLSVSDERYVIREELDIPTSGDVEDRIEAYRAAEGTYRRIKHSLTNEGAYGMAGEFYIHEMRMKRDRYWHQRRYLKWLGFWISALMTGYGEKGRNVIMTALAIVAFYAIAYHALGAISQDGGGTHCPTLSECVYFSLVTFTTLGYGDYAPIARYQLLAVSEAFIGAFMIALFVLVFGRKVMR
ncbi:MAG TPA: hypothetical protein EYP43_04695, partial [Thermoplasmata archaeon]|nr:hypothetical protein [Thermoplasmata archaeon]